MHIIMINFWIRLKIIFLKLLFKGQLESGPNTATGFLKPLSGYNIHILLAGSVPFLVHSLLLKNLYNNFKETKKIHDLPIHIK